MEISLLQVPHKLIYYIHCSRKLERERVVNIIKLPPVLPGELELEAINRSLRSGEAALDWGSRHFYPPKSPLRIRQDDWGLFSPR
jgi:hypothetical protein